MAERDSTPEHAVPQSKITHTKEGPPLPAQDIAQQLVLLDNGLHQLLCTYRFYQQAIEATTAQAEPDFNSQWHYGLVLVGDWLQDQGSALLRHLDQLQIAAKSKRP